MHGIPRPCTWLHPPPLAGGFVLFFELWEPPDGFEGDGLQQSSFFELWEPPDGFEGDGLQQSSLSIEQLPPVTELQRLHEKYVHDGDGSG